MTIRMVPIEDFYPFIAPVAGEVPDFLIRQMLAATAADLCQRAHCLTTDVDFVGKADKADYVIPIPTNLEPETIRYVYVDGLEVSPVKLDTLSRRYHRADWAELTGTPRSYVMKDKRTITLVPCPVNDCTIRVVAYASVIRNAIELPYQFFSDYLDVLVEGTLSRIYRVAGQPFSNSQLANVCSMRYESLMKDVQNEAVRDFSRSAGHVEFNRII